MVKRAMLVNKTSLLMWVCHGTNDVCSDWPSIPSSGLAICHSFITWINWYAIIKNALCRRLPIICPPFYTLLWGKCGKRVFAQLFNSSCANSLYSFPRNFNMHDINNHNNCCSFLEKKVASLSVYCMKSKALALILSRRASIISGDRGRPQV